MKSACLLAWLGAVLVASAGLGDEPRPAIEIRLNRPDRQVEQVIGLFRGARVPHPAAALAAWKRASAEPNRLGKPLEALIAAINPQMAGELRTLDGAGIALDFDPATGRPGWRATLPNDDGAFAALASALVLSGGEAEPPLGDLPVDRLGPPGAPLMARSPAGLVVAGSREGLQAALEPVRRRDSTWMGVEGVLFRVDAEALGRSRSIAARRLSAALLADRLTEVRGSASLAGSGLVAILGRESAAPIAAEPAAVDPAWLDWIPADRAMAAFAVSCGPEPGAWDAAFQLADIVEKVDPARAGLAPLRIRIDLLARAVGVRTEVDLIPRLAGVSGWVGADEGGIDRALIALHLVDEAAATRLFERIKPPAAVRLARRGRAVAVAWGEGSMEAGIETLDHPARSARAVLSGSWGPRPPVRAGGFWPGRAPGLAPPGSPLARTLAGSGPILWAGHRSGGRSSDRFEWNGLDDAVRRFLEMIPLDPPPDH